MPNSSSKRVYRPFKNHRCGPGYGAAGVSYLISVQRKMCLTEISFYTFCKSQETGEGGCFTLWYRSDVGSAWSLLQEVQSSLHPEQSAQDGKHHLISDLNLRFPRGTHDLCIIAGSSDRPLFKGGPLLSAAEEVEDDFLAASPFRFVSCRRIRQNGELYNEISRPLGFRGSVTFFEIEFSLNDFFRPSQAALDDKIAEAYAMQQKSVPSLRIQQFPMEPTETPVDSIPFRGSFDALGGCCSSVMDSLPLPTPHQSSATPQDRCWGNIQEMRQISKADQREPLGVLGACCSSAVDSSPLPTPIWHHSSITADSCPLLEEFHINKANLRSNRSFPNLYNDLKLNSDTSFSCDNLPSDSFNIHTHQFSSSQSIASSFSTRPRKGASRNIIQLGESGSKIGVKSRRFQLGNGVTVVDPLNACRSRVKTPPETPRQEVATAATPRDDYELIEPRTRYIL